MIHGTVLVVVIIKITAIVIVLTDIIVIAGAIDQIGRRIQHLPHDRLGGGFDDSLAGQHNAVYKVIFGGQEAVLSENALVVPVDNLRMGAK